jgi:S-adenosylmethionine-diacylglycerol 3-amino-3-carboxypropyl transferase
MMLRIARKQLVSRAHDLIFRQIHGNRLVYNACWEDPRIDRQLLQLDSTSKVVMITSAGCNALDYLLDSPAAIHAIDVNPRQNALLELKLSLFERGKYDDLFAMFGIGCHYAYRELYASLRRQLSEYARDFWDTKIGYFDGHKPRRSFYYHGTSGNVAWFFNQYLMRHNRNLRYYFFALLEAHSLEEQRAIYRKIDSQIWNAFIRWLVQHPVMMAMVGVPRPQIQIIASQYPGGLPGYVRDNIKKVFTEVLMADNYFWRVYLTGSYTPGCCPAYLQKENFELLRANRDRIHMYTGTITEFLQQNPDSYDCFILLDHQDWLAWHDWEALLAEWEQILRNSRPGSKILMRSSSEDASFLPAPVRDSLRFFPEKTAPLHKLDRVGTYRSLHLAEVL